MRPRVQRHASRWWWLGQPASQPRPCPVSSTRTRGCRHGKTLLLSVSNHTHTHIHTHLLSVPPDNQHEAPWLWTPPAITDSPDQRTEKQTPSGSGQAAETIAAMATDGVPLLRPPISDCPGQKQKRPPCRPCVPPPLACRHHPLRDGNLTCFNVFPVSSHFFPSFFSQSA